MKIWRCLSGVSPNLHTQLKRFVFVAPISFNCDYFILFLSFFRSNLRGPKAYSLWDGLVPNPSIGYDYL